MVMVGVDDHLAGAIELLAAVRPEVREIVEGLRRRGIKHIAIISGDHEAPTRKLAESLGTDRYFAQVLPADKADYVEKLQREGCKVCFVGDGINDSIASKKANVSISLRGASSIATDTAQIVFLEDGLAKLCELRDIARAARSQREAELVDDPGAEHRVHRRASSRWGSGSWRRSRPTTSPPWPRWATACSRSARSPSSRPSAGTAWRLPGPAPSSGAGAALASRAATI